MQGDEIDISFDAFEDAIQDIAPAATAVETPAAAEIPAETSAAEIVAVPPAVPPVVETPEPAEVGEEELEATVISEVITGLGFEDIDAADYDDTPEGIQNLVMDAGQRMAGTTLDKLFNAFPTVKQHLQYLQDGGNPAEFAKAFAPQRNYNLMEFTQDSKPEMKTVLKDYFQATGQTPEFAADIIESYEDKGVLLKKAEEAKAALGKAQTQRQERLLGEQRAAVVAQQQAAQETWQAVQQTVLDSDALNGVTVSKKERGELLDYISKPVTREGHTQRDMDLAKLSLEQQLSLDYLMMKGLDLSTFAGIKSKTNDTKSLKERLASKEARTRTTGKPAISKPDASDINLNLDSLF